MPITKAIITSASPAQARLPLQTVVDRSGQVRTALELVLEEIVGAGIEDVAIVICPGTADRYQYAAGDHAPRITFFEQKEPLGYGHALLQAKAFAASAPFLHLVSDHLYVSKNGQSCAAQLVAIAEREQCAVSAIQPTRENQLAFFGAVGGVPVARHSGLYEVSCVVEKPTPTTAEQKLVVAGQRAGHYLCLFGMHVLTPSVFELLEQALQGLVEGQKVNLSSALDRLAQSERYLAAQLDGERYNIGEKYGLLVAQLAIALSGGDRDRILTELVELLAKR